MNGLTGATYEWTGPDGFLATGKSAGLANVGISNEGVYSVRATVAGCRSLPQTTFVDIASSTPTPTASNSGPQCPGIGNNVQLTASTVPGADFYIWTLPNNTTLQTQNPLISNVLFPDSGWYYVSASIGGCQSIPDSTFVDIEISTPTPLAADDTVVVCPGTTLYLNASAIAGSATYKWNGPSFNPPATLTPNMNIPNATTAIGGLYYIRATMNNCTSFPDTVFVKVEITTPTPEANANNPVCPGTTLKLTASNIPGANYSWTGPGFSNGTQNPLVNNTTTAQAGDYIVTAEKDGCVSLPDTISVRVEITTPTPTVAANSPVCEGKEISLSAASVANAMFDWSGPAGFSATTSAPSIGSASLSNAGEYIVYAIIDECRSLPASVTVAVKPAPVVTVQANSPLCEGEDLVISAEGDNANIAYVWTGPALSQPLNTNVITLPAANRYMSGTYTVQSYYDGCSSLVPGRVDVLVKPLPDKPSASSNSTEDDPKKPGEDISLFAASGTKGVAYSWVGPNNFTSVDSNPVILFAPKGAEGEYIVTASIDGCESTDTTYVKLTTKTFGMIMPNPNQGKFTVIASILEDQTVPIDIVDAMGAVVYQTTGKTQGMLLKHDFDLTGKLSNGVYFVRMAMKDRLWSIRFIITQ